MTELKPSDPPVAFAGTSAPAAYWLALRGYDPPAVAATLPQSWLVLQGERDYQVTTADFARWRQALTGREDCRFHSYPALNHMFIAGVGRSHPGEYGRPGHVAAQVIDDIAAWVAADSPRRASPGMAR